MRISDGSSDVCSSDLSCRVFGDPQRIREARPLLQQPGAQLLAFQREGFPVVMEFVPGLPVLRRCVLQIGRASCRERVCQYGVDLGGRRSIKKQKQLQKHEPSYET